MFAVFPMGALVSLADMTVSKVYLVYALAGMTVCLQLLMFSSPIVGMKLPHIDTLSSAKATTGEA